MYLSDSSILYVSTERSTKDVSVNTPRDIDLNFQLHSLTERCITLNVTRRKTFILEATGNY